MRALKYDKAFPPRKNGKGEAICRWTRCRKVLSGRRTSFCSDRCRDEALIRCWPTKARAMVLKRDKGICAACGLDCVKAWRVIVEHVRSRDVYLPVDSAGFRRKLQAIEAFLDIRLGNRQTLWEANHIEAVVEGGGGCGLDNYETLCLWCHRAHTAQLRKRLAASRQEELQA